MIRRLAAALLAAAVAASCGAEPSPSSPPASPAIAATAPASAPAAVSQAAPASSPPRAPASAPAQTQTPTSAARPTPPPAVPADWPGYHGGGSEPGVATSFPAANHPAVAWSTPLDGAVYGQPIGVDGMIITATENDSVYRLDPSTGAVVWRNHLGTPVRLSTLPCGNIDPLGITSTPAYDASTGSVFVVAETQGPKHTLYALNPKTGAVRWSRSVDTRGDSPSTHQQRAALLVANGRVYIGFGGLAGDCGQYVGEVVGVPVTGTGSTIAYRVPVEREGAVWSAGAGPIVDPAGHIYVSTGNGSSTTAYDGSDSVIELSPTLHRLGYFAPGVWANDNARDADLGSMAPALTAGGWVFIAGKNGTGYVLMQGHLGGVGGQVSSSPVCAGFGGSAVSGRTIYVPCADGIRRVTLSASGRIHVDWGTTTGAGGPPVLGGGAVWTVNISSGELYALRASSGAVVGRVSLGAVPHFASPTLWGGLVLVGTMHGATAVKPAP
jgi:outer membrane protein assembly factor BamB